MKILAIETASEACSASLVIDNKFITRFELAPREHTKLILPMMEEVLEEAGIVLKDVDAIAFSRGPGAFTGLRIAAGVAQGVALSVDKPVIPVSTLEALALQAANDNYDKYQLETIVAALDARMGEVYWGLFKYEDEKIVLIGEEKVSKPEFLLDAVTSEKTVVGIGSGWDAYEESLFEQGLPKSIRLIRKQYPSAESIAKIALIKKGTNQVVPPEEAQPVYIRNNVAEKSKKKL